MLGQEDATKTAQRQPGTRLEARIPPLLASFCLESDQRNKGARLEASDRFFRIGSKSPHLSPCKGVGAHVGWGYRVGYTGRSRSCDQNSGSKIALNQLCQSWPIVQAVDHQKHLGFALAAAACGTAHDSARRTTGITTSPFVKRRIT